MKNILITLLVLISSIASAQTPVYLWGSTNQGQPSILLPSNVLTTNGGQTIGGTEVFDHVVANDIRVSSGATTGIWMKAAGGVAIGSSTVIDPVDTLTISRSNGVTLRMISADGVPAVAMTRTSGSLTSPTAVTNNTTLGGVYAAGYDTTYTGSKVSMTFRTTESWSAGKNGSFATIYYTPTNSSTIAEAMSFGVPNKPGSYSSINSSSIPLNAPYYLSTPENSTYALSFTTADSLATIQAALDAAPIGPPSTAIICSFAAGTYNWSDAALYVRGSTCPIYFNGATYSGPGTNQTTIFSNAQIYVQHCPINFQINDIRMYQISTAWGTCFVVGPECTGYVEVNDCYFQGRTLANGGGIQNYGNLKVATTRFSNAYYCIYTYRTGRTFQIGNSVGVIPPGLGLAAVDGGIVQNGDATSLGTTAHYKATGGQISISASTWF